MKTGRRAKFKVTIGCYGTFTRSGVVEDLYSGGAIVTLGKDLPGYPKGSLIRIEDTEFVK